MNPTDKKPTNTRSKRLACVICRKRKLKCDGAEPNCMTCTSAGRDCVYENDVRRKSGPRKGYVRALETRLAEVEKLLEEHQSSCPQLLTAGTHTTDSQAFLLNTNWNALGELNEADAIATEFDDNGQVDHINSTGAASSVHSFERSVPQSSSNGIGSTDCDSSELQALGIHDALPNQAAVDELHEIFFTELYEMFPLIHRARYLAGMSLPLTARLRPPIALSYAIWGIATSYAPKYAALTHHFYERARSYAEQNEAAGDTNMFALSAAQTWLFITMYEAKGAMFGRAWLSLGKAMRLSQLMALHRLDGAETAVRQVLPPPQDWIELEERRRTFWALYIIDRILSSASGLPMMLSDDDIRTNLPDGEEAFKSGNPTWTTSLKEALTPAGIGKISAFGNHIVVMSIFGRTLLHYQRREAGYDDEEMPDEQFWQRHNEIDGVMSSILTRHSYRLQTGDTNMTQLQVLRLIVTSHASVICLQQAAIHKANKSYFTKHLATSCRLKALASANEIVAILRQVEMKDLKRMGPFVVFCLYTAARVFATQINQGFGFFGNARESLRYLRGLMSELIVGNQFTEKLLAQLDVDAQASPTASETNPVGHVVFNNPAPRQSPTLSSLLSSVSSLFTRRSPGRESSLPASNSAQDWQTTQSTGSQTGAEEAAEAGNNLRYGFGSPGGFGVWPSNDFGDLPSRVKVNVI